VEHFVDWLAGQAGGIGTEQTRSSGIGKADVPLAVHAANAVGNRVEQDLLLPVKLLCPAAFVGPRQHLSQRGSDSFYGGQGFAVFAQSEMTVEFQNRQHLVAFADRNRPSGDHLVAQSGLNTRVAGTEARSENQTGRPSCQARPARSMPMGRVSPMLSWMKVSARRPGAAQAEPNSSRFSSALTPHLTAISQP